MRSPRRTLLLVSVLGVAVLCLVAQAAAVPTAAPDEAVGATDPRAKVTVMTEDFEGSFPSSKWTVADYDPTAPQAYWGKDDFEAHNGANSAWVARSGPDGRDPEAADYPSNMTSRMWYGPFDLSNYYYAQMDFWYWRYQTDPVDQLNWVATNTKDDFDATTGLYGDSKLDFDSGGWVFEDLDLSPFCGDSEVWVGFNFRADATGTDIGVFVDDISVWGIIMEDEQSFKAQGAYDGWVRESGEDTAKGGKLDAAATTARVGDDASDRQYRAILDFNTAALPDDAVITAVTLRIARQAIVGTNPFDTHGYLVVDMRTGAFHNNRALEKVDFQAPASRMNVGRFLKNPSGGGYSKLATLNWYRASLRAPAFTRINLTGPTQFRLRFELDDNDDMSADYLSFFTGNSTAAKRPQLIVDYYVP